MSISTVVTLGLGAPVEQTLALGYDFEEVVSPPVETPSVSTIDTGGGGYYGGKYNVICDVCGWKYKSNELIKRWDGAMVCKKDFETRHMLDFYRTPHNQMAPPYVRPDNQVETTWTPTLTGFTNATSVMTSYRVSGDGYTYCNLTLTPTVTGVITSTPNATITTPTTVLTPNTTAGRAFDSTSGDNKSGISVTGNTAILLSATSTSNKLTITFRYLH